MTIGTGVQKLSEEGIHIHTHTQTHTQQSDFISLLSFQNEGSCLETKNTGEFKIIFPKIFKAMYTSYSKFKDVCSKPKITVSLFLSLTHTHNK
jgi:hypothetical protein